MGSAADAELTNDFSVSELELCPEAPFLKYVEHTGHQDESWPQTF